jgi:cytochrome c-type biogenesis protein CcmH/NrfG
MKDETPAEILALLVKNPSDAQPFQDLGCAYFRERRLSESLSAFRRSLELDENDAGSTSWQTE